MNVLSLFSGIGGLDLGLERAGMTVAGQVEINPWCQRILAKHWPEVPRHDDVRTCTEWWGERAAPDLVCGGFPCQPVSLAGKRLAQADSRWLWPAFAGIVRDLGPRYVLVENVPGLLGRGMGDVLGDLAELGYDAEWDCVPAAFVGAPHIRNRVWIVAYPGSARRREDPGSAPRDESANARRHAQGDHVADCDGQGSRAPDVAHAGSSPRRIWPGRRQQQPQGGRSARHPGRWPAEPGVGRVAYGIPGRVDRLRGLGNAVVPQVAEHIGRLILAADLEAAS